MVSANWGFWLSTSNVFILGAFHSQHSSDEDCKRGGANSSDDMLSFLLDKKPSDSRDRPSLLPLRSIPCYSCIRNRCGQLKTAFVPENYGGDFGWSPVLWETRGRKQKSLAQFEERGSGFMRFCEHLPV